jgi:membrane associated rhomboid family serine protease
MRDAAVGFQCPDCVALGAKQTRAGRTAYGGLRPTNATITSAVLIGINALVWLAITVTGGGRSSLVTQLALRPNGICGADQLGGVLCLPGVDDGAYWQLLTGGFVHVSVLHIAFNMLALYSIGPQLELALGRVRFLALYFLSLLAGSAAVMWFAPEFQQTIGASGAIYGLFGALLVIARKVGGDLRSLIGLLVVNLFITFTIPGISWQGHLGGFVGGVVITALLVYAPTGPQRTRVQVLGLGAVGLLVVAAILARIAVLG